MDTFASILKTRKNVQNSKKTSQISQVSQMVVETKDTHDVELKEKDIDISILYEDILSKLVKQNNEKLTNLLRRFEQKNREMITKRMTIGELNRIQLEISSIQEEIEKIKEKEIEKEYVKKLLPIVEKFNSMSKEKFVHIDEFIKKKIENPEERKIVRDFLREINKFYNVRVNFENNEKVICEVCGNELDNENNEEGIIVCKCGNTKQLLLDREYSGEMFETQSYEQKSSVDIQLDLDKIQGIQKINTVKSDEIFLKLDQHFLRNHGYSGEQVREMQLNSDGRTRGQLGRQEMINALIFLGYQYPYQDCNFFLRHYWNWNMLDLTDRIEEIKNNYTLFINTEIILMPILNPAKRSKILKEYVMRKIFDKIGIKYQPCIDFKIISINSILNYEVYSEAIFKHLHWEWKPLQ